MGGDHTGRDGDDRSLWTGEAEDPAGRRSDPEEMLAKVQAAAEEMTMRRYVHMPPEGRPAVPRLPGGAPGGAEPDPGPPEPDPGGAAARPGADGRRTGEAVTEVQAQKDETVEKAFSTS